MSQKQPGCLSILIGVPILGAIAFLVCGGCLIKGNQMLQDAAEKNAQIEAAKSPEQKAKEKAESEEAALELQLTVQANKAVKEALEYPLNSTIHLRTKYGKKDDDTRAVMGKVDASNAFNVKKTLNWLVVFKKQDGKWNQQPVVFEDAK